jgi:hypothetical protein
MNQQVSPRAVLGSQRVNPVPTNTSTNLNAGNNSNVQKVEVDAIMRAA